MADLRSVSACAQALGIQRQRLSLLLTQEKIKKVKQGRESLVDYDEVCALMQRQAAEGKVRTPKKNIKIDSHSERLIAKLEDEVMRLRNEQISFQKERESLLDKVEALSALEGQVKLLKAANIELEEKAKRKGGVLSRIERAIGAFKE